MKIWERAGALVAAAGVVAATACAPHAGLLATGKDATVAQTMSSGHDDDSAWGITRVGDKWQVSLRLSEPAPVRDTPPLLAVDGKIVGAARESADRRTLTVLTDGPVQPGGRVSLWSPADESASGSSSPSAPVTAPVVNSATIANDPGVTGPFHVAESEYDF